MSSFVFKYIIYIYWHVGMYDLAGPLAPQQNNGGSEACLLVCCLVFFVGVKNYSLLLFFPKFGFV